MQHHRKIARRSLGLLSAGLLVTTFVAAGCGPRVWADGDGLAILGTAPEPEAAPAPEPEPQKRVEVRDNKIVINEKVQFEFDSAKIQSVSHSLLDEVAKVIKENPQIKKIEIEGHASAEGSDSHNMKLSDRRAKAVMKYLTGPGGVDKGMFKAKGYGETRPVDSGNPEGEVNRRVEFTITEQEITETKVEVDDQGNEKVLEQNKKNG